MEKEAQKASKWQRLKSRLQRTRRHLGDGLGQLLGGYKAIDDALLEALEAQLLMADMGLPLTEQLLEEVKKRRKSFADGEALYRFVREYLAEILQPVAKPLTVGKRTTPFVILVVGINGVGKTTSIGKLAKYFMQQNQRVMLAAGDTFRAAAIEQLQVWGQRHDVPVIAQESGADSASVIFDAFQAAKARRCDVLLADTAGRLHTQLHLLDELKKVKRVLAKLDANAPHEVMLVLDATIGQNALNQAREFHAALDVTGITLTKLDGTAKGGTLFAMAKELAIPLRFIGVGEGADDLKPFVAQDFVAALFD